MKSLGLFFHNKRGEFKPPFFWSTLFLFMFAVVLLLQIIAILLALIKGRDLLNLTALLGVLAGLVLGLIAVYNMGKNNKGGSCEKSSGELEAD